MDSTIKTYRNNTEEISCIVSGLDSLSGYTGYLTVVDEIGGTEQFSINTGTSDGDIVNFTITFRVSPSNNNITAGIYKYDIVVSDGTDNYTVAQGKYIVLESVKYS